MSCLVTAATDVSNCYALVVFFFVNIILEYSISIEESNYKLWRWLSNSIGTLNMHLEFASWYLLSCQINLNLPQIFELKVSKMFFPHLPDLPSLNSLWPASHVRKGDQQQTLKVSQKGKHSYSPWHYQPSQPILIATQSVINLNFLSVMRSLLHTSLSMNKHFHVYFLCEYFSHNSLKEQNK